MASPFRPFNPRGEFKATHRNLPHWHQPGATYFVTFRLADSLPSEVRERFEELRRLNDSDAFAWMERYLDAGSGSCLLKEHQNAMLVAETLRYFDGRRYLLGTFVVMPNHVHALVHPIGSATLTTVLHGWKSYSANQLQRRAGIVGRLWQEESFDRLVRDETELTNFHNYILGNPAAARLPPDTFILGHGSADWPELTT